jgi:ubiquinone biosynthesis protein
MKMPSAVQNLQRWREIQALLLRYGFDMLLEQEELQEIRRTLHEKLRLPVGEFDERSLPERVRLLLQDLGPTYVKLGQLVSSRSDLLPAEWVQELAALQDKVPPFAYEQVRQIVTEELGAAPEELFAAFEETPLAAASIGQVHAARLLDGSRVVVKVQRPGIQPQVRADLEMMRQIARLMEGRTQWGRKYGVAAIVEEFARTLNDEMDYRNEGRHADRLRRNLSGQEGVHVPFVYWEYVTARVLTMEDVSGLKINDVAGLKAAGVDTAALADTFVRSIFQQLLIDGFFHADPHPGNLFVDPVDGVLVFLDLGMMGEFLEEQRHQLSELVQAIVRHDSREVTRLVLAIGTAWRPVREMAMRREVDRILNRYLDAALAQIQMAELLRDLLGAVFGQGVRLPSELTMGIKTLIQAEEVARTLNPEIQIAQILQIVAQQLLWQRLNPRTISAALSTNLREALRLARALPRATEQLLAIIESGALRVGLDIPDFHGQVRHLYTIVNRLTAGLIVAGMIIGSAIAMGAPATTWRMVPIMGMIGFIVAMVGGGLLVGMVVWDMWRTSRSKE